MIRSSFPISMDHPQNITRGKTDLSLRKVACSQEREVTKPVLFHMKRHINTWSMVTLWYIKVPSTCIYEKTIRVNVRTKHLHRKLPVHINVNQIHGHINVEQSFNLLPQITLSRLAVTLAKSSSTVIWQKWHPIGSGRWASALWQPRSCPSLTRRTPAANRQPRTSNNILWKGRNGRGAEVGDTALVHQFTSAKLIQPIQTKKTSPLTPKA